MNLAEMSEIAEYVRKNRFYWTHVPQEYSQKLNEIDDFLIEQLDSNMNWMDNPELSYVIVNRCINYPKTGKSSVLYKKVNTTGIFDKWNRYPQNTVRMDASRSHYHAFGINVYLSINDNEELEEFSQDIELYVERLRKVLHHYNSNTVPSLKIHVNETNTTYTIFSHHSGFFEIVKNDLSIEPFYADSIFESFGKIIKEETKSI